MKTTIASIVITLLLSVSTNSFASSLSIETALSNFNKAAAGDASAVGLAREQFQTLLNQYPEQPLYEARLGSLITMQARDAWAPWKKMSFSEQGLEYIDTALERLNTKHEKQMIADLNVSLDVRYTAAITFSNLPRFFNRWGQAERILRQLTEAELLQQAPAVFQAQVWWARAQLAKQREKMQEHKIFLQKVIELDASSPAAIQARTLLAEIEK